MPPPQVVYQDMHAKIKLNDKQRGVYNWLSQSFKESFDWLSSNKTHRCTHTTTHTPVLGSKVSEGGVLGYNNPLPTMLLCRPFSLKASPAHRHQKLTIQFRME